MPLSPDSAPRRGFLARAGASLAALVSLPSAASATPASATGWKEPKVTTTYDESWLRELRAPVRQAFDISSHADGQAWGFLRRFLNGWTEGWGIKPAEVQAVAILHGSATEFAFNDAIWAKYKVGDALKLTDPATRAPALRNAWYAGDPEHGLALEDAMQQLQARGTIILVCHNATKRVAGRSARASGIDPAEVLADYERNLAPGCRIVPAAVSAISRAQHHGCTYVKGVG
ncbi:MAG: hypothetical protein NW201_14240 [Gemmatimonadales bacterium]|nr:hypothetical protein [Gemmatimonadales bacterium]